MRNNLFSKLTPKEPKFFPLLSGLSDIIVEISDLLINFLTEYQPESAEQYYKQIKDIERKGDKLANNIFDELNASFITPFDREDINELSGTMDDVNDYINSAAKRIYLYRPEQMPNAAIELAKCLKNAGLHIKESVDNLSNLKDKVKDIKESCNELHTIENKADDIYEMFLIDLFKHEKNAVEIIKVKEIVYELEKGSDAAERVGKIIKKIIVKYA